MGRGAHADAPRRRARTFRGPATHIIAPVTMLEARMGAGWAERGKGGAGAGVAAVAEGAAPRCPRAAALAPPQIAHTTRLTPIKIKYDPRSARLGAELAALTRGLVLSPSSLLPPVDAKHAHQVHGRQFGDEEDGEDEEVGEQGLARKVGAVRGCRKC